MNDIALQALRITSGWFIEWNLFYEVNPKEGFMHYLDSSSLLHLTNHQLMRSINLDFKPEVDVNAHYYLKVINLTKTVNKKGQINYEGDWENPYFELITNNRLEVVHGIEGWLFNFLYINNN